VGILGNDVEGDSDGPAAPVKTVEKTSTHTTKRNADGAAPAKAAAPTGARRTGGASGNEAGMSSYLSLKGDGTQFANRVCATAFRDRNAGSDRNRGKPTEESGRGGSRGGYAARGRGSKLRTQDGYPHRHLSVANSAFQAVVVDTRALRTTATARLA
jgi:plasminogen activator inhibitor 1 RNA-binding protein